MEGPDIAHRLTFGPWLICPLVLQHLQHLEAQVNVSMFSVCLQESLTNKYCMCCAIRCVVSAWDEYNTALTLNHSLSLLPVLPSLPLLQLISISLFFHREKIVSSLYNSLPFSSYVYRFIACLSRKKRFRDW